MADQFYDNVCSKCIGDEQFSNWIKKNGMRGECDFDESHASQFKIVPINDFAEEVDRYFRDHYGIGEEYPSFVEDSDRIEYLRRGSPLNEVITDLLQTDSSSVVDATIDFLPDSDPRDGDLFYDSWQNYESLKTATDREKAEADQYYEFLYEEKITSNWKNFCETVKHRRRFFNNKKILDNLFGPCTSYEAGKIKPIYQLGAGEKIFRARLIEGSNLKKKLEQNPAKELSSPPKEKAVAGRMNVGFIPVFYGAFDRDTALSEVRPSIDQLAVVGEFVLQKDLRVFDFTVFDDAVKEKDEDRRHTRYHFIRHIHEFLARPVSHFEKDLEYIPTQVVAEYLKSVFNCDAIIYKSSLLKNSADKYGKNIVLLSKQSGRSSTVKLKTHLRMKTSNILYSFVRA
jgi:hypothetical protein